MLRTISTAVRGFQRIIPSNVFSVAKFANAAQSRCLGTITLQHSFPCVTERPKFSTLLSEPATRVILPAVQNATVPVRTLTKFSMVKGKRKAVKAVLHRFKRLHWGAWIRTIAGRHRHLWKKSVRQQIRLKQHVFCNGQQSWLLDKMTTKYWRKPRHYVDDPYSPYHQREDFFMSRKKPLP